MTRRRIRSSPKIELTTTVIVGGGGGDAFSDFMALSIIAPEANAVPTDSALFALAAAYSDNNDVQSESVLLGISGTGINDSNAVPTDTNSFTARVWLSATTMNSTNGVTNPANANGQNDGTVATYQSAALGDTNPRTTSTLGANVPAFTVTSAIIRVWFRSANTLVTSSGSLIVHSITALFADIIMFTNNGLNSTIDHLGGTFTFDLVANGINTLAEIQSIQFIAGTADAVAGVTPHVLTLDAACVEIVGAFT